MPRFFFDTDDGSVLFKDQHGIDLPNKEAARDIAVTTLPFIADNVPSAVNHHEVAVHVKDEDDEGVLEARLSINVEWK